MAAILGVGLELLTLPLSFWSGFLLEHRYDLSNQTLGGWVWRQIKGYLVGGVLGLVMLFGFYGLLQFTQPWWLSGGAGVAGGVGGAGPTAAGADFAVVLQSHALAGQYLAGAVGPLAEGTGLTLEGVYRLHLSADARKANAALAGLGRTRHVLLGDTLLDNLRTGGNRGGVRP